MGTRTKEKLQIGLEEKIIEDAELEKILDERQELKYSVAEYKKRDKEAKSKIQSLGYEPPFRIGRFLVTKSTIDPRDVSFTSSGGTRIDIKIAGEE